MELQKALKKKERVEKEERDMYRRMVSSKPKTSVKTETPRLSLWKRLVSDNAYSQEIHKYFALTCLSKDFSKSFKNISSPQNFLLSPTDAGSSSLPCRGSSGRNCRYSSSLLLDSDLALCDL